jgi:hypothetical protein
VDGGKSVGAVSLLGAAMGILVVAFSMVGGSVAQSQITNVTANVTIFAQIASSISSNLSGGVQFGNISNLPQTNLNASHNNDSNSTGLPGILGAGNTSLFLNISTTTNVNVTVCLSANDSLRTSDGVNTIPMSGFTWNASSRHGNATWWPWGGSNGPLTNLPPVDAFSDVNVVSYEYAPGMSNISVQTQPNNATVFFRFWLDLPGTQTPGDYYDTLTFKTVRDTNGCGTYP